MGAVGTWAAVLIAAVGSSLDAGAGGVLLEGQVRELGTRDPLAAASVECDGVFTETDADGRFTLWLPPGARTVHVAASGYHPRDFAESAAAGTRLEVVYRLERKDPTAYRTTVTDQKARTESARVALDGRELEQTAGSSGEPLRGVMQLPGVSGVASGLAYPVVRGTQPAATGYFVERVRVPQLFHAIVGLSVLHPDFVEKIDFFPGLPPVAYGRLLGGAVDVTAARPRDGRAHATLSLDLVNASAFVAVPIEKTGTEVTAAGRYSYTPLIGAKVAGALWPGTEGRPAPTPVANFWDYQARVAQRLGPVQLRALVFGAYDQAGLLSNVMDTPSGLLTTTFHRGDLTAQLRRGPLFAEAGFTLGADSVDYEGEQGGRRVFGLTMKREVFAGHGQAAWTFGDVVVRGGVELEAQRASSVAFGKRTTSPDASLDVLVRPLSTGLFGAAWLQAQATFGAFSTTVGLRGDVYQLGAPRQLTFTSLAPRLEERLKLGELFALRAGAGAFYQPPTVLLSLPASELSALEQGIQWGLHFEGGADVKLPLDAELGLTAFFHPLPRTVEYRVDQLIDPRRELGQTTPVGSGRSYGLELFLRRAQVGRWYGWLSATLQRSERRRTIVRYDDSGAPSGEPFAADVPFAFDQLLVLNATFGVKLPRGFSAGLSVHFNTGRPEGGDISSRNHRPATDPRSGAVWWVPQDLDRTARLPPFFRLDVRVAKTWTLDDLTLELYLDVFNASAGSEVLGYTYAVANPGPAATLKRDAFAVPIILPMLGIKGRY